MLKDSACVVAVLAGPWLCSQAACTPASSGGCAGDDACSNSGGAEPGDGPEVGDGSPDEQHGTCSGIAQCGYPPHCALGCYLKVGFNTTDPSEDTCAGVPDPCNQFYGASLCAAQGCLWSVGGSD